MEDPKDVERDLLKKHLEVTGGLPPMNVHHSGEFNTPPLQESPELEDSELMKGAKRIDRLYDEARIYEGGNLVEALRTMDWGMIRDCLDYAEAQINSVSFPENALRVLGFTDSDLEALGRILPQITEDDVKVMETIEKQMQSYFE